MRTVCVKKQARNGNEERRKEGKKERKKKEKSKDIILYSFC